MHRFYISPENWNHDALALTGSEAHHSRDVLRMKRGEKLVLCNGRGREITAEILDLSGDEIRLRKLHEAKMPPVRCRIVLGQAIPKGKNMELIVQKAVEIGAAEIAPIISDRTVVQVDSENAVQKKTKWQQIAIEAAKQCGQNWLPRLHAPGKLADFFDAVEAEAALSDRRTGVSPAESPMSQPSFDTLAALQKDIVQFDLRLIGPHQPDAQHLNKSPADSTGGHQHRPRAHVL